MDTISLIGPGLNKPTSTITETKNFLVNQFPALYELLLHINAHGDVDNHLQLLTDEDEEEGLPLHKVIYYLTDGLSPDKKRKLIIDIFACHAGANVRPTKKSNSDDSDLAPGKLTEYEEELSEVLANSSMMVILNGGKYPTPVAQNNKLIKASENQEIEEILISRMLEPSTLKIAVNNGGEETEFLKFGAPQLKQTLNSPEKIKEFIRDGLIQRIQKMVDFLKEKYPERSENIDELQKKYLSKLSEENFPEFIDNYLGDALFVEILKTENEDNIEQRLNNIKMLLEVGVNINKPNDRGETPLYIASENGHKEAVKTLAEAGADVNKADANKTTPLWIASQNGHKEIVEILTKMAGANINLVDDYNLAPIHIAARNGHIEVVRVLIDVGDDVNKKANHNFTPLYFAAYNGHSEVVKFLINSKADINETTESGKTPLWIAIYNEHTETVKTLLEAGSDVNKADDEATTPLALASRSGNYEIVEMLIEFQLAKKETADQETTKSLDDFFEDAEELVRNYQLQDDIKECVVNGLEKFKQPKGNTKMTNNPTQMAARQKTISQD